MYEKKNLATYIASSHDSGFVQLLLINSISSIWAANKKHENFSHLTTTTKTKNDILFAFCVIKF